MRAKRMGIALAMAVAGVFSAAQAAGQVRVDGRPEPVPRPDARIELGVPGLGRVGIDANDRIERRGDVRATVVEDNAWRYRRYNSRWWYWMPDNHWVVYLDGGWQVYAPGMFSYSYSYDNPDSYYYSQPYRTGYRGYYYDAPYRYRYYDGPYRYGRNYYGPYSGNRGYRRYR